MGPNLLLTPALRGACETLREDARGMLRLLDLLRELDLERLHSDLAEAAGGTSLHHLKTFAFSLAELESVASLGVPKIRARKLWRKVEVATTGSSLM